MQVSSWYTHQVGNQWHHLWHWQKTIRNWHNDCWESHYICCYYYWWHWILGLGWEDSISSSMVCDDVSKSPMLQIAVEKALRRSCHDNMGSTEFFEGITTSTIQFMGFVSQHTKQGYPQVFTPSHLCCLELMCTVSAQLSSVHSLPTTTFSQICRTDCYSLFKSINTKLTR